MARLSIGEFARACGLSAKALRIYDELGLLPPAEVDQDTGYRSYRPSQLDRARLVSRLRQLGMPLARIRIVCDLAPRAAAAEVSSYWRQVEADTSARKELACFLIEHLAESDIIMTDVDIPREILAAAQADRGLVRPTNDDVAYAGKRLFAVADGFAGSGATGEAAIGALRPLDDAAAGGDVLKALACAAAEAEQAVAAGAQEAGTTLTAMLFSGAQVALVHVGDSRAYQLRGDELTQLTHDHSYVQSLVDEGRLTQEEAANHPKRATLLRALSARDPSQPDLHLRAVRGGDRYLLCSDGVHAVLAEQHIERLLRTATSPEHAVGALLDAVRAAGAPDNAACVVADV